MKQIFALCLALVICLLPQVSFAHSKLVSSTPAADSTITEQIDKLRLTYNTTIEQGSTLTIEDKAGKKIPVEVEVQEKDLIATLATPLPTGVIKVNWKIIGADGHLIDGNYQFTYQVQQPKTSEQKQPKVKPAPPNTTETSSQQTMLPWLLAGLFIMLIVISIVLFRSKGKKNS